MTGLAFWWGDHKTSYKMNNTLLDKLAYKNFLDYFRARPQVCEGDSDFIKAAHAFYTKITTQAVTKQEAERDYAALMKIPLTYSDMRGMFG